MILEIMSVKCMDTSLCLSTIFIQGISFSDLLPRPQNLCKWDLLLTLLHSEWPKLHRVLAILSAIGLKKEYAPRGTQSFKS